MIFLNSINICLGALGEGGVRQKLSNLFIFFLILQINTNLLQKSRIKQIYATGQFNYTVEYNWTSMQIQS